MRLDPDRHRPPEAAGSYHPRSILHAQFAPGSLMGTHSSSESLQSNFVRFGRIIVSFNAYAKSNGTARMMALVLAFVALFGFSAIGQEVTGSLTGTVVDPSGAAIPNARVEVTGVSLPQGLVGTTNSTGNYAFNNVPAGAYTVTATVAGFSSTKQTDVNVVLGRTTQINFRLEVGQVTESVVVSADAVMVDTTTSSSSVNVDKSFFDLLPKGRSFYDLAAIAPGARAESKTGGVQVDGASGSENTFFIDGMEVTNIQTGVLSEKNRIPVEMIQQTQIKNGVMEAQYGGAMGGVISAVVRSGSNDFHGMAGFYFNNDEMEGRPRDSLRLNPFDETKGEYFRNQADDFTKWNPVFNIAGPIVRNKLFFFSGFMPTKTVTHRDVTFNSDGKTRSYTQNKFQHYMTNKLDYMPFTKLRTSASWTWNPNYTQGLLPGRGGTDDPSNNWAGQGGYDGGQLFAYSADYLATSKLVFSFRGGYHYTNHNGNYAIPNIMSIYYSGASRDARIPAALQGPAGYIQYAPGASFFDKYKRHNYNADVSYLGNWMGQHNIKGGWQMNKLANEVLSRNWANGYLRYYWFSSWTCITSQCSGRQTGNFGYARYREYGEMGNVSSNNQALFFQDTWRVNKYLTLNLGIRTEREFVPSFATAANIPSNAIEFPWSQKLSPRVGFAFDPRGDGKQRIYASWGRFFDIMKYELPRGSFGGNVYYDYYYTLDDATAVTQNTSALNKPGDFKGGKFLEYVNWRIPSNDPDDNTIDPNLKPMQQQMFDIGYERSISSSLVASARYTNRRLIRTIEDVGTLGADGEIYYIANPGEGITADPKTWEAGIPVTPKPKRNYDALEMRLDKRFSKSYQFAASYTWSRSYGNYAGLASSDENGRTSPNVNRYFDLPWIYYTEQGKFAEGRLATDRPHTFKFFGGYTLGNKLGSTTISPNFMVYSGTPITTEANLISSTPGCSLWPRRSWPDADLQQYGPQRDARLQAVFRKRKPEVPLRVDHLQRPEHQHRDQQEQHAVARERRLHRFRP
jgi:hypothetical protein